MRTSILLAFILLCLGPQFAYAAYMSVDDFSKEAEKPFVRWLVFGMGEGLAQANVEMKLRGNSPLYCPPPFLALNDENYLDILRRHLFNGHEKMAPGSKILVESELLKALRSVFPCK